MTGWLVAVVLYVFGGFLARNFVKSLGRDWHHHRVLIALWPLWVAVLLLPPGIRDEVLARLQRA